MAVDIERIARDADHEFYPYAGRLCEACNKPATGSYEWGTCNDGDHNGVDVCNECRDQIEAMKRGDHWIDRRYRDLARDVEANKRAKQDQRGGRDER